MRRFRILLAAVAAFGAAAPSTASATYSIVATDSATQQVGGAGTSCVGPFLSVYVIYGSAPGKGVIAAQAQVNYQGRDQGVTLLGQGMAPADIITAITSPSFDPFAANRQYGVVALPGLAAGFTGSSTLTYAEDRQGQVGTYTYSTQGNILTSAAVLDQTSMAFETQGCDLADKLMLALEAGGQNGEGDSRCTPDGIPSDGAFIQVDLPTGAPGSYLMLKVDNTKPNNPLTLLRAQFDTWRATHPCAGGSGGAGGAGSSSSGMGAAGSVGSGIGGGATTATTSSGMSTAAAGGGEGGGSGVDPGAESGCGCRLGADSPAPLPGGLIAGLGAAVWLGLRASRRQRRAS